ncbi:hypothetical protein OIU34_23360 [Pararhizobium sp. BT-229]|uniref:hypothetical protein n=1 Tax=Pararhizobium sp. BT-229 TaxID=2986923 RepID=UPI0021F78DA3|nr:hypothetical protein [Pararhizobium sp. BT-229]MCV9964835.1 hypothetical protein [Pararhizobium sp. BT-229]
MRMLWPIKYGVRGKRYNRLTAASYCFLETVPADIRVVAVGDAPIAVEWVPSGELSYHRPWNTDCDISGPDGTQITRWYSGRHWQRLCEGHLIPHPGVQKLNTQLVDIQMLERRLTTSSPVRREAALYAVGLDEPRYEPEKRICVDEDPRQSFRTISKESRTSAIQEVEVAAANLICIENTLYRKCLEPFISISMDRGRVFDIGIEASHHARGYGTAVFELNQWGKAVDFANSHESLSPTLSFVTSKPTIWLPESIT